MSRRSARNQKLPIYESNLLQNLTGYQLYARAKTLYDAGWTLRAIGESLTPPRARSTVRYWIVSADLTPIGSVYTDLPTAPVPTLATPASRGLKPRRPLTTVEFTRIKELAPSARRYRATMKPGHRSAQANNELTEMCVRLHHEDRVTIKDLAEAAGVSYRAMARRVS